MEGQPDNAVPEELVRGRQWLNDKWYILENDSVKTTDTEEDFYRCPCCGYKTLDERGSFEICHVCFWEDDGQDEHDADTIRGGPNGSLSLTQARTNYQEFGACERRLLPHVRPPLPDEY